MAYYPTCALKSQMSVRAIQKTRSNLMESLDHDIGRGILDSLIENDPLFSEDLNSTLYKANVTTPHPEEVVPLLNLAKKYAHSELSKNFHEAYLPPLYLYEPEMLYLHYVPYDSSYWDCLDFYHEPLADPVKFREYLQSRYHIEEQYLSLIHI